MSTDQVTWRAIALHTHRLDVSEGYIIRYDHRDGTAMVFVPRANDFLKAQVELAKHQPITYGKLEGGGPNYEVDRKPRVKQ